MDLKTSSDDVEESKPAPDIFEIVLKKLKIEGTDAVAIGDTPYDADAAGKASDHRRTLRRVESFREGHDQYCGHWPGAVAYSGGHSGQVSPMESSTS